MTFTLRLAIVIAMHFMVKGFDHSFDGFLDYSLRGISFSIYSMAYWLGMWYSLSYINKIWTCTTPLLKYIQSSCLVALSILIYGLGYRFADIFLFENHDLWILTPLINFELTLGVAMIVWLVYMLEKNIVDKSKMHNELIRLERLENENLLSKFNTLKSQIEPHFLFNSLSVLSSLMHTDVDRASEFIVKLSKTMRHVLEKNETSIITLHEELNLVDDYFFLLKARFNESIHLDYMCDKELLRDIMVPPAMIQGFIENAIKHNAHTVAKPLRIRIEVTENHIRIRNNINTLAVKPPSTSTGILNAHKRYRYLTGKHMIVQQTNEEFLVILPILTKFDYACLIQEIEK